MDIKQMITHTAILLIFCVSHVYACHFTREDQLEQATQEAYLLLIQLEQAHTPHEAYTLAARLRSHITYINYLQKYSHISNIFTKRLYKTLTVLYNEKIKQLTAISTANAATDTHLARHHVLAAESQLTHLCCCK